MKKISTLLMLFCAFVCSAWAGPTDLPELTTDKENPVWYTIKNVRGNAYAAYEGKNQVIKLNATIESPAYLFYFTEGSEAGTYKIHNYANELMCAGHNSWTAEGIDWYIKASGNTNYQGLAISKQSELTAEGSEAWNDYQNKHTSLNWYGGNDAGSVWVLEKHEGAMPGIQLSTEGNIVLHYIRSNRRTSYVNFDGHNKTFKEGNEGLNSYWYFVEDKTATEVPAGYVAVKIFNAAHPTAVENYTSGYMEDSSWSAKTFYIGLRENNKYGYVIRLHNDEGSGWHDYSGSYIGQYGLGDDGSLWRIYPAGKTVDEFKTEANNVPNLISLYEEADFYTYSDEALTAAKSAIEGVTVNTVTDAINVLKAYETLKATEKNAGPVAGQVIQLKNKAKNQYMTTMAEGDEVHRTSNANDLKAMWVVVEGTDGNVKLKNVASGTYLGVISQSAPVKMVAEENAAQFTFSHQVDMYGVFKPVGGGTHSFAHMDGWYDRTVGWEKVADASQWIISELTADETLDLMAEAHNTAKASIGTAVGMYKETPDYLVSLAQVEEILNNIGSGESEYDTETLLLILNWFNTTCADATEKVEMAPGYYYVKATGTGNRDTWYLSHKIVDSKECLWAIAPTGKLNADFIWKFETCEDGYKMQSVNLGQYFQLKTATNGGDNNTYIENDFEGGNKFLLTDNGAGKLSIKNSNNENIRTENGDATGAQVNYWNGESTESWYLIPVTELEVDITAAGWATLHLPFDVVLPGNLKAYAVSKVTMNGTEGSASLVEKTSIPANEGAVLEGAQGTYKLTIAEADAWTGNMLKGSNVNTYIAGPAYVLGIPEGESEVMFAKAKLNKDEAGADGTTHFLNNANKAYLPVVGGASLVLRFNFGGETTAIESVLNNGVNVNAPIYDLSGRRVMNAVKGGIYIQNGKKFIVK